MKRLKIAVLFGGCSPEYSVSLQSAAAVLQNMDSSKYEAVMVGISIGFQYSFIYLSASILQWIINGYGTSVIGAFTATSQIEILIQQPFTALGTAMATYTGQNIGAGKTERVGQGLVAALKICVGYSFLLLLLFWGFGRIVMNIFVSDDVGVKSPAIVP